MVLPQFSIPEKRIYDGSDLGYFQRSAAYKRLHQVISVILGKVKATEVPKGWLLSSIVTRPQNQSMTLGKPEILDSSNTEARNSIELSSAVLKVVHILDSCDQLIDKTPPLKGPRRFGNMACRDWHAKLDANVSIWLLELTENKGLIQELEYYLLNSFGSALRLDYGSGHELSFVAFLGGLMECGILDKDVLGTEILAIFARYYDVTRRLIVIYNLEPAGSHGVWGLDDHFHFIYVLGAAQFNFPDDRKGTLYVPAVRQVLSPSTIDTFKETNLYVNAIAFIFKIKTGPFSEHSPILYDVANSVSLWSKVLSGLLKMYEVEVFGKFPVVQHFWFGSGLYPWKDAETMHDLPIRQVDQNDAEEDTEVVPGLINGFTGTKTTRSNITLTGAPWARKDTQADTRRLPYTKMEHKKTENPKSWRP